jgi:hypothetical protein
MINIDLINPEFLDQEIAALEQGYVQTVVNVVKGPVFIENCRKSLEDATGERKEALEKVLETHMKNQVANEEAIVTLNDILPKVKALIK